MKISKNKLLLPMTVALIVGMTSCDTGNTTDSNTTQEPAVPGIDVSLMDTSVAPGDDFFRYVNGKWLDEATIPDDRTRWGSFDELRKNTDADVLAILADAVENNSYEAGTDQRKAVDYYQSYMDTTARNTAGIEPLKPYLADIDAISDLTSMQDFFAKHSAVGLNALYGMYVSADSKNSDEHIVYVHSASYGLGERDYYLEDDADSKEKREKYKVFVAKMLQVIGDDEATAKSNADKILAFETRLVEPLLNKDERRDPNNSYNPKTIEELQKLVPSVEWKKFAQDLGIETDKVIVSQLKFMTTLESILKEGDIAMIKTFLRWRAIDNAASLLSMDIDKMNWTFYSKEMRGAKTQRALKERALSSLNNSIGEAVGQVYVDKKFPPEAKAKAVEMVDNILFVFGERIKNLDWMSDSTKTEALNKLSTFTVKIGYPDKWKDYSKLNIASIADGGSYFENNLNVNRWEFEKNIAKLGTKVDKSEWYMAPQVVNAYYNPRYNEIVFPAAILQPPFYNYQADAAVNFGGIGGVIGHEISHGFDDYGSKYDAEGNMNNWWTESDLEEFDTLGGALVAQFDALEPLPEVHVNGTFTLGENIGDLGGVNVAYDGLQKYLADNGNPGKIDGFTPEQRFFLSWGTIWRGIIRDEALKNQIKTDPHSPQMYRSYVPLQNVDAFYEAFNVTEENELYLAPEDRVRIW